MRTSPLTPIRVLAAFAALLTAPAFAQTAVTAPVGFRTETIGEGFNLLSTNLSNAVSAAGDFDSAGFLADDDVDFTSLLTSGTPYTVKLLSGGGEGLNGSSFTVSPTQLVSFPDISGAVAAGDSYEVRATQTISQLFGAGNEAGLGSGPKDMADIVWVPIGASGPNYFARVHRSMTKWSRTGFADYPGGNTQVYFTDGLLIQRNDSRPVDVVFTGHVQTTDTVVPVHGNGAFNFLSRVLPVGVSLDESRLADSGIQPGPNSSTADVVWVPTSPGNFKQYYYATNEPPFITEGWKQVGEGNTDFGDDPLSSGYIVQRRGASTNLSIPIPAGLDLVGGREPRGGGGAGAFDIRQPTDRLGFQIASITRDSEAMTATLSWDSVNGATYRVLETLDFRTYAQIGSVVGDGGKVTFVDTDASQHCSFYILESDDL